MQGRYVLSHMKYFLPVILLLLIGSCQQDSYWVDSSYLHIKTDQQTLTFSGAAKDSLLSIISNFEGDHRSEKVFFTDILKSTDVRFIPHPDIFEKYGDVFSEEEYRSILLSSTKEFPDSYFITDRYYNDNIYNAIVFSTDLAGSAFFEMHYITFDTLKVSYSEDFFPNQLFSREVIAPEGFDYVRQREKERADFRNQSYQKHFHRLNEESIFKNCRDDMIQYRLSKFPSYDPYFTISVIDKEGKIMLYGKKMIEAPYDNKLAVDYSKYEIELTTDQRLEIASKIDKSTFWDKSPTRIEYIHSKDSILEFTEVIGTGGAMWLFEGCRLGEYHGIDRWSGTTEKYYRVLFNYLTQIAEYGQ